MPGNLGQPQISYSLACCWALWNKNNSEPTLDFLLQKFFSKDKITFVAFVIWKLATYKVKSAINRLLLIATQAFNHKLVNFKHF